MIHATLFVGRTSADGTRTFTHDDVTRIVGTHYEGFTAFSAEGHWQGETEACTVVHIAADGSRAAIKRLEALARDLASQLSQECVLLSVTAAEVQFVSPRQVPA